MICWFEDPGIHSTTWYRLTDGASAVLVMEEEKARELGYPTDIVVRSYVKTAVEPFPQLLIAPAIAISQALDRAGLKLGDIDLFEIHEAFAAQVLATLRVLASKEYCKQSETGVLSTESYHILSY